MDQNTLYRDIAGRCHGDIYLGVVGPVRTGKSTFIKRFMELLVLPNIPDASARERTVDELPQSGAGRTIMTTQPRFVPDEAVEVRLRDEATARVRLVDCVGYLIPGVLGLSEGESARMVRTPWFEHDIPFEEAAEVGTRRVIQEHATIGVVVSTDGSIVDMPRSAYEAAEERVVRELKALGKPFIVALNSRAPSAPETQRLRDAMEAHPRYEEAVRAGFRMTENPDFDGAVSEAASLARPGDTVILSPASASFDHFKNFEERGRHFKELVKKL